ncbi:MAG: hypothetical protein ACOY5B_13045 [Spirochaetota bacterium]
MRNIFVLTCLVSFSGCNSLIDETARVEKAYELKAGLVPQVSSTDPADNTFAPITQTYVDVVFSNPIDAASFSAQSTFGACSGSFQLSYDGFNNCLAGTVDVSANPRIRFTPTVFPKGLGLQIRVAGVLSPAGNTVATYTSAIGFRLAAPCGNQNCFFSYSTPLMTNTSGNSGLFLIRSGTHQGKFIAYTGGTTSTTLIDLTAGTSVAGPTLCGNTGAGVHNFYMATGFYPQQQMVVLGAGNGTCRYDPVGHTFVAGPTLPFNVGAGAHVLVPRTGSELGNAFVVRGANSNEISRYDGATGTFGTAANATGTVGPGGHAVRLSTGTNAGRFVVVHAGLTGGTTLTTEDPLGVAAGPAAGAGISVDGGSFEVTSGVRAGELITMVGNNSAASRSFNTATLAAGSAGPSLASNILAGGLVLRGDDARPLRNPLVVHGSGHVTSTYDADSGNFTTGPFATGFFGAGSASVFAQNAASTDFFLLINGSLGSNTSVYLPGSNRFHGSRLPRSVPNIGAHAFYVASGINRGKTIVVAAGGTIDTAVFDPLEFQFSYGPQLTGAAAANSFNFTLTAGPHAGKTVVFLGNGTNNLNFYDPATNTFAVPVGWPTSGTLSAMGNGASAFQIGSGNSIMIVHGGNTNTTQILDQATGALTAGPNLSCNVNSERMSIRVPVPSSTDVRQLIFCSGTQFAVFDHATQAFSGPITTFFSGGAGMHAAIIPSSSVLHGGKAFVLMGNSVTTPFLFNASTNTIASAGITMTTCAPGGVNAGAQLLPLVSGTNSGRFVIVAGNGTRNSCIYDPATHTFTAGPFISSATSPGYEITQGSVAFRTQGGLYPTAFILASGSNKNVWNAYVP